MGHTERLVRRYATTKLQVPGLPVDHLERPRLEQPLREAVGQLQLVVVQAPAGYGKSVLAATLADGPASLAWFACDAEDDEPLRLGGGLVAALATAGIGQMDPAAAVVDDASELEDRARAASRLAAALVNGLPSSPLAIVVDDLHRLGAEAVDWLAGMVERLPAATTLVASTREPLGLPTARLQARGQAVVLHAAELALTREEVARMFPGSDDEQTGRIHGRTGGWPAAVRLAMGTRVAARAVDTEAGDVGAGDRVVHDLLAEEVLGAQPEGLRDFLLAVSVLDDLDAERCRVLTGRDDAGAVLEELWQRGLFLTSRTGGRYRLHDLMRDFLQAELERRAAGRKVHLHGAAARIETDPVRVVAHLVAARRWEQAAAHLVQLGPELLHRGLHRTVERWLAALPARLLADHPRLALLQGRCAYGLADAPRAERLLERALVALEDRGTAREVAEAQALLADCAFVRGAFADGDQHVRAALASGPSAPTTVRLELTRLRMAQFQGDITSSDAALRRAMRVVRDHRDPDVVAIAALMLWPGVIVNPTGADAVDEFCALAGPVLGSREGPARVATDLLQWATDLYRHLRLDLDGLEAIVGRWERLGGMPPFQRPVADVSRIFVATAVGRWDLVDEHLSAHVHRMADSGVRPLAGTAWFMQARAAWSRGDLPTVRRAADEMNRLTGVEDTLVETLTAAVSGVAAGMGGDRDTERQLLAEAVARAEAAPQVNHFGSCGAIAAWRAMTAGEPTRALELLGAALDRVAAQRLPGRVLLEGRVMAPVLRHASTRGLHDGLVRDLLGALGGRPTGDVVVPGSGQVLTSREVEVLARLTTGATNRQIADDLVVSPETVKSHVARLLRKLDVSSRSAAAARASQLGVQGPPAVGS